MLNGRVRCRILQTGPERKGPFIQRRKRILCYASGVMPPLVSSHVRRRTETPCSTLRHGTAIQRLQRRCWRWAWTRMRRPMCAYIRSLSNSNPFAKHHRGDVPPRTAAYPSLCFWSSRTHMLPVCVRRTDALRFTLRQTGATSRWSRRCSRWARTRMRRPMCAPRPPPIHGAEEIHSVWHHSLSGGGGL